MPKWDVPVMLITHGNIRVDAETQEEAHDTVQDMSAEDALPKGNFGPQELEINDDLDIEEAE